MATATGAVPSGAAESYPRKMSLQRCELCNTEAAKYRCPRCMKYSCSLACVKKHKALYSCNGTREKAAFVSMNKFSNLTLLSDYRFLEDVGRMTDRAARDTISHKPKSNRFVNFLRNRARRCKICLQTLPIGFTKRRENSTFYSNKEQKFYWHLKLLFPQSHAKFTEQRVPDDKPLCDILKTYIDPQEADPVKQQRLKIYTVSSQSDIQILLKVENRPHNSIRILSVFSFNAERLFFASFPQRSHLCQYMQISEYFSKFLHKNSFPKRIVHLNTLQDGRATPYQELDANKSLLDNLKGKVVIEYPTLHVVLRKFTTDMVILGQNVNKEINTPNEDVVKESSSEEDGEIHDSS